MAKGNHGSAQMENEGSLVVPTVVSWPVKSPGHIAASASARHRAGADIASATRRPRPAPAASSPGGAAPVAGWWLISRSARVQGPPTPVPCQCPARPDPVHGGELLALGTGAGGVADRDLVDPVTGTEQLGGDLGLQLEP